MRNRNFMIGGARDMKKFFHLHADEVPTPFDIDYELFDFDIIDANINPFADSLINEIWPLLRLLWKSIGPYEIEVNFDPEQDFQEFGPWACGNFKARYIFKINKDGEWDADFYLKFIHDDACKWTNGADQSWANSVAASRARLLAVDGSNGTMTWNDDIEKKNIDILEENKKLDFSFETIYVDSGKWN